MCGKVGGVLSYSQFGSGSEEAYFAYLRVTALTLLRRGSVHDGRALVEATNGLLGRELGGRSLLALEGFAEEDRVSRDGICWSVSSGASGVSDSLSASVDRGQGFFVGGRETLVVVDESCENADSRVKCSDYGGVDACRFAVGEKSNVDEVEGFAVKEVCGKQSKKNARKRARAKAVKAQRTEVSNESGFELCVNSEGVAAGSSVSAAVVGDEGVVSSSTSGRVKTSGAGVESKICGVSSEEKGGVTNVAVGGTRFERSDLLCVTTGSERKSLARQWFERKTVENQLAIQRAKYNVKRNEYLDRSRISEQRWETERLNCDAKLARISAARLGCVVGSAETVISEEEKSLRPPSLSTGSDSPAELSDGTISPDSSISVAEGVRLSNKVKKVESENAELKLKYDMLVKAVSMGGSKIVIDGKNIHEYDGTGQYVPPFEEEVESLYDGRGHLLDAWEAGMDY